MCRCRSQWRVTFNVQRCSDIILFAHAWVYIVPLDLQTELPELQSDPPELQTDLPELQTDLPELQSVLPELQTDLPELQPDSSGRRPG